MIEGLKISVSSDELKAHLQDRSDYHDRKAGFYHRQAQQLKDGGAESSGATVDPVSSLEQQGKGIRFYLKNKADQAWLVLEYQASKTKYKGGSNHFMPEEERALREGFSLALSNAKRGVSS